MENEVVRTPIFIGVAGGTCSGKTTLAQRLGADLETKGFEVRIIHMDAYFKNPTPTVMAPFSGIEYPEHNHPESIKLEDFRGDLQALKDAGQGEKVDIVIVEGLFVLQDDRTRGMLDLKLFVDTPADERCYRRIKRGIEVWKQDMETVAARYLDTVRFRHDELVEPTRWHADLVVNGTNNSETGFSVLRDWVTAQVPLPSCR